MLIYTKHNKLLLITNSLPLTIAYALHNALYWAANNSRERGDPPRQ